MRYLIAESVQEALKALADAEGKAIILSGGTDLVLDADSGKKPADMFIDVMRIPELKGITVNGGFIEIGASTTLTSIASSPVIRKMYPSLAAGCGSVGSLQIRNAATLTGNVVSAQPAADGAMALAPLDPEFTVAGPDGERKLCMEEMYAGFGRSTVDPYREIVTLIRIPVPAENQAASFYRLELRKSLSLPMLNCAATAVIRDGIAEMVRITMGPVGVGPKRAKKAEEFLTGRAWTPGNLKEAGKIALEDAAPRSNPLRGSREYRTAALPVIIERALLDIGRQLDIPGMKEAAAAAGIKGFPADTAEKEVI